MLSIIIVNYNGRRFNDDCIRSLLGSTVADEIKIIIVDNGSTDGSIDSLKEKWEKDGKIVILELGENFGFSKGNNEGIKWSIKHGIDTFLLLNNDTEVEPDAIEKMIKAQKENNAIVVPKILLFDRKDIIWAAGGCFSKIIYKSKQTGLNKPDSDRYDKDKYVSFATGCAMMLNKEIIEKMGLLDERFFLYYEDTEYSLRARTRKIPIVYCHDARVYHKVSGSTGGRLNPANEYYIARNWLLCNLSYLKGIRRLLFISYFYCNRVIWSFLCIFSGKRENAVALCKGIQDYRKGTFGRYNG